MEPEYISIPFLLIRERKLNQLDLLVYGAVLFFSQLSKGTCIASNTLLASICQTTVNTVQHSLQKLEDENYIVRKYKDPERKIRLSIDPLIKAGRVLPPDNKVLLPDNTKVLPTDNESRNNISTNNNTTTTTVVEEKIDQKQVASLLKRWEEITINFAPKFYGIKSYRQACERMIDKHGFEDLNKFIDKYVDIKDDKYTPDASTPVVMEKNLERIVKAIKRNNK